MRYSIEVSIQLPRNEVFRLFNNTENLYKWQEGLLGIDHLEGKPWEEGAVSRLVFAARKGDLVMTETITKRNFPDEFGATYKAKGVYNEIKNYFTEPEPGLTRWKMDSLFRFKGLMALMAPFMKNAFKANSLLSMERFKAFAEQSDSKNAPPNP
jgi:hypothetical protein